MTSSSVKRPLGQDQNNQQLPTYKLVVSGAEGVGKSSLTIKFFQEQFIDYYDPGTDHHHTQECDIDGQRVILDVLDTAGQEEFSAMREQYMRDGYGFLMVYSVTDEHSFQEVRKIVEQVIRARADTDYQFLLVANKIDQIDQRKVTEQQGRELAYELNVPYIETSADDPPMNVDAAFHEIIRVLRIRNEMALEKAEREQDQGGGEEDASSDSSATLTPEREEDDQSAFSDFELPISSRLRPRSESKSANPPPPPKRPRLTKPAHPDTCICRRTEPHPPLNYLNPPDQPIFHVDCCIADHRPGDLKEAEEQDPALFKGKGQWDAIEPYCSIECAFCGHIGRYVLIRFPSINNIQTRWKPVKSDMPTTGWMCLPVQNLPNHSAVEEILKFFTPKHNWKIKNHLSQHVFFLKKLLTNEQKTSFNGYFVKIPHNEKKSMFNKYVAWIIHYQIVCSPLCWMCELIHK